MIKNIKTLLLSGSFFIVTSANAQLEVSHLSAKGFSSVGMGAFYNFGIIMAPHDAATFETSILFFDHAIITSTIWGWRYTFNDRHNGLYIEPQIGYSFGGANLPKSDSSKYPSLYSGGYINQPFLSGFTTLLGFGYIFPGKFSFNLGARYEHIFTGTSSQADIFSLRLSRAFTYTRRKHRC
jgi:hypothetical protein